MACEKCWLDAAGDACQKSLPMPAPTTGLRHCVGGPPCVRLWFLHVWGRKGKTVTMQVFGGLGGTPPIRMPLVLLFLKTGYGCPVQMLLIVLL